jgi:hypothetical protein
MGAVSTGQCTEHAQTRPERDSNARLLCCIWAFDKRECDSKVHRRFGGTCCLFLQWPNESHSLLFLLTVSFVNASTLKMEAARCSKTSVKFSGLHGFTSVRYYSSQGVRVLCFLLHFFFDPEDGSITFFLKHQWSPNLLHGVTCPKIVLVFLTVSGRPDSVIVAIGMIHCLQTDSTISFVCERDPLSRLLVLHGLSPWANYTDRATAASRRSVANLCG